MTFTKYYIEQLKDIPVLFREAKRDKKMWAFLIAASLLLSPMAIFIMYLFDTGKMKIDSRYSNKTKEEDK
ncbi:hypothetical protein [Treponema denticola]|uniref:hypothetical protein n=1 Tax=Treponema denticola TaxID=158 RepID=UPI0020A546E6|nr:hypothetical protein [Treponema denticola]UTC84426.1 hypothetical protein E4N91_01710 [Treponema denticola]